MSGKITERGKLYISNSKTVFVSSGQNCPRVAVTEKQVKFRDDYSKGFKSSKKIAKLLF